MPIARIGVLLYGEGGEASAILRSLDWQEAPEKFCIQGSLRNYEIGVNMALESFVSSAKQFHFDAGQALPFLIRKRRCRHHRYKGMEGLSGIQYSGTQHPRQIWTCGKKQGAPEILQSPFVGGKWAGLFVRTGEQEQCLAKASFPYQQNGRYRLCLSMSEARLPGVWMIWCWKRRTIPTGLEAPAFWWTEGQHWHTALR